MREPTREEIARREGVLEAVRQCVRDGAVVRLPELNGLRASSPQRREGVGGGESGREYALLGLAELDSPYAGSVGDYRYFFEGEEDLLHLVIVRSDRHELSAEEAQRVCAFVLEGVPPSVLWIKPGTVSQHFYLGHEALLE